MRLSIVLAVICWLLVTYFNLIYLLKNTGEVSSPLSARVSQALFMTFLYFFYRYAITKSDSFNFLDLLWKVFVSGLVTTLVSLAITLFYSLFGDTAIGKTILLSYIFYHINVGMVSAFLISTFIIWKKLILYQKSKLLMQFWSLFEYSMIGALLFDLLGYKIPEPIAGAVYIFLLLQALVLTFNLKWVAYLNFKQKWKSILFIFLVTVYLWHFFKLLYEYETQSYIADIFLTKVFIAAMASFILIYAVIAILVILFNLPTSSVFERKIKEAMDFQRLSQSIPAGQTEEQVYEILLDSSMSAVFADAAWIEIEATSENKEVNYYRNINKASAARIKESVRNSTLKKILKTEFDKISNPQKITASLKNSEYKTIMVFPVMVKNVQIGSLALLKEVSEGFNREMINIINTFVNQASISVENFRLINEALENERYKEELKIAKKVQKALLPEGLEEITAFEIHAYSVAADEVGGDYYDILRLSDEQYAFIIADVSGKGTSAAFHMAQMKGIFHSVARITSEPDQFLIHANDALSVCLEKASFITGTFFQINTTTQTLRFSRAGHCPSLFYCSTEKTSRYFQNKGLGLGIVRNKSYGNYVQVNEINYTKGDIIILYTDGITEAINSDNDQFGYERLKNSLELRTNLPPEEIKTGIIDDLYGFTGSNNLDDDYTLVIIKF
ncbi:MAG: GAF domain-containing SpoIIE family protein phosphatase [Cyclobacteriaceae bacterium]